jgi:protein phosphatase
MKKIHIYAESNVGKDRSNNEDNFYCGGLFRKNINTKNFFNEYSISEKQSDTIAVFDGMGGTNNGELASLYAAAILNEYTKQVDSGNCVFDGNFIISKMNEYVCLESKEQHTKMGSTVVMLRYENAQVQIFNLGDSRAYILRNNELSQLTVDHTEENALRKIHSDLGVDYKLIDLSKHNTLTQHLGITEDDFILEPSITEKIKIKTKDVFLLCSDGLTNMLTDKDILKILNQKQSIKNKGHSLIMKSLENGGKDNITVILFEVY